MYFIFPETMVSYFYRLTVKIKKKKKHFDERYFREYFISYNNIIDMKIEWLTLTIVRNMIFNYTKFYPIKIGQQLVKYCSFTLVL